MSVVQERLDFDAPATRGASRQSDPWTARAAGRSMQGQVLRDQQQLVLDAVRYLGTATAWEVHRDVCTLIQQNVIAKRLSELRDLGLVRVAGPPRPGSSHRLLQVWEVVS